MAEDRSEVKAKPLTEEQARLRREVNERNRRIQEAGIKAPKSGVFGGKPKKESDS